MDREALDTIRIEKGLRWSDIATEIDRPLLWTISAIQGQHPVDPESATKIGEMLDLDEAGVAELQRIPTRGALPKAIPTDPTTYRFYEVLQVYGPALKAAIHEEFGDGIMSAINFSIDIERAEYEQGDRVKVTMEGNFLPYQWDPAG